MNNKGHEYALVSLILGIASICLILFNITALLGIGCGIAAIILSKKARESKIDNENMAKAGFILGIIGLVIDALRIILAICLFALGVISVTSLGKENINNILDYAENTTEKIIDKVDDTTNNSVVDSFNAMYKGYKGINDSSKVVTLLNLVASNNKTGVNIIEIDFDNIELTNTDEILSLISKIDASSKYDISLEYSDIGYIDEIEIEKEIFD